MRCPENNRTPRRQLLFQTTSSATVMRESVGTPSRAFSKETRVQPDDKHAVTAPSDGTARLWDVFTDTQKLISAAKMVAPRCLTAEQREASFFLRAEPPAWCIEMAKWPYQTATWKEWLADERAGKNPRLPTAR